MKIARYLLIFTTAFLVVFKLYYLNGLHFDIDVLEQQLVPVKKYIKPHTIIALSDDSGYEGIYMSVEYIMAPTVVIIKPDADTVLLIQSKGKEGSNFSNYRTIVANQEGGRLVSLITKVRR